MRCLVLVFIGCATEPTSEPPIGHAGPRLPITYALDAALATLAAELPTASPGTDVSVTVEDLATGARVSLAGDELHVSASSAKAWWVAAALDGTDLASVQPYATPIFAYSDNSAAGAVIDLIGPNAVNTWMWDTAGMTSSALTQWSFDTTRIATNSPGAMGGDNYMTSNDAVEFLARVYRRQLLADERGAALMQWLTLSPNTGTGGWLVVQLPAEVKDSVMHKAGWLPPGCCSDDSYYNTANEIGIVVTPAGPYAVAILARRGTDYWNRQVPFVERASCIIYRAFADADCDY